MKVTHLLGAAGAILIMTAGAALAAEACACCKDMAADAAMECCDQMKPQPPRPEPAPPAPAPSDAPAQQGDIDRR